MKRSLFLFVLILFGAGISASASHDIGGEISYKHLSANNYQVFFKLYRDCTGIQPSGTYAIQVQSPGCNTGRIITVNQTSRKTLKPYGPAIPVVCSATGVPTIEVVTYTGMLTFSAAEAACANWVLSWNECCRLSSANLVGQDNLYTETTLKLQTGLVNSSPAFDTLHAPVIWANVGRVYNFSMAATDPDGDSLVYKLVAPLAAANSPVPYKPFPGGGSNPGLPPNMIMNPSPRPPYSNPFTPQLAQFTTPIPTSYSPQYPMPAIYVNWNSAPTIPMPNAPVQPFVWEAKHIFDLNPVQGELKFAPSTFYTTATMGVNRYNFSVMVEEYRKINGVMTKLGAIRRETMIEVTDNFNRNPEFAAKSANGQAIPSGYEIKLRAGTPLTLNFSGFDPDTNQVIVSTNATYILSGATFTASTGSSVAGAITWTPTAAHVRWQPYFFQVMFRDDANPLRGVWIETFAVRVSNTGGVTGTPEALSLASFSAFPNPFSQELNFSLNLQTKAESILIYNLLGQKIDEISLKTLGSGEQKVQWQNAAKHAAGTYVARLVTADKTVQTLKFTKVQ